MAGGPPCWLLIGNSRWHWAEGVHGALRFHHDPPPLPAQFSRPPGGEPVAWAAVGRIPPGSLLPGERRLQLEDVPLRSMPPWLGIDRALAGWQAWREDRVPVLVVDAGTVLSFTRVDREGRFAGGRLMAGVALQLRAMVAGAAGLEALGPPPPPADRSLPQAWPALTAEAMTAGVRRGLAAAIVAAAGDAVGEVRDCRIVITGGDAPLLLPLMAPELERQGIEHRFRPELCLEALVGLRPWPPKGLRESSGNPLHSRARSERI